jgi:hypothetical protein
VNTRSDRLPSISLTSGRRWRLVVRRPLT